LSREDWLLAARAALIAEGKDAVKVERLAKTLNVTRGGFYWHFKDRDDLMDALLESWEQETTKAIQSTLEKDHTNGMGEFLALVNLWVDEKAFSPAYDTAVRDWARTCPHVARAVKRVDSRRIDILKRIFLDLGYDDDEAFIRARITYFHQVGYYTLGLGESHSERRKLLPLYIRVLTGHEAPR
jgi:AcrR family transcriptional regulator